MDALQDEVESLEAILMDDVRILRNTQTDAVEAIETTVLPVTGEEDERQYICVTLLVLPTPGYPDVSPEFKLLRPRGLDDTRLEAIRNACIDKIKDSIGFPVVFDLIEVIREHLTGSNLPSGQCVICLYGFCDGDEFTRTECFHYLHSYCLARHLNALRRNYQEEYDKLPAWLQKTADPFQAACPVCREKIKDESDSLKCAMPPSELENAPEFKVTNELRELQQRMSNLYLQQKSRGAIIDVDAEGAAVISIETEEEIERRLRRKQRDEIEAAKRISNNVVEQQSIEVNNQQLKENAKPTTSNTFAPVVQSTHRAPPNEPANNNYQHNRRHYRGGRHHHHRHHHNHHHRSDRDATASHSNAGDNPAGTSGPAPANGKQAKAHAAGGAHAR